MHESDERFYFWQRWLTYANILTALMGLLVAFAGNSVLFDLHNHHTKAIFLNGAEFTPNILAFKNWLFGIIGGTMVGFHILMVMISENAFRKKEMWAYNAVCYGIGTWFLIDSGISIYYGAIHNVILINVAALLLIGLPLISTRKAFKN